MTLVEILESLLSAAQHTNKTECTVDTQDGQAKLTVRGNARTNDNMLLGTFDQAVEGVGTWLAHPERVRYYVGQWINRKALGSPSFTFHVELKGFEG